MKFRSRRPKIKKVQLTEFVPASHIIPTQKVRGAPYSSDKRYKYFAGHIVPEVSAQLPEKTVICWKKGFTLSLKVCSLNKFWLGYSYCKRCSLFQQDEFGDTLETLIKEWERDDVVENEETE